MADHSGKSEPATQRRLEKAREEGQFPSAREFVSALQFMVFLILLGAGGVSWFSQFCQTARAIFMMAFAPQVRIEDLTVLAWQLCWKHFFPLVLGGMVIVAATLGLRLM